MGLIRNVIRTRKFRSRLEKYCAQQLKENGIKFGYETEKIVLVPKFRYEGVSLEKIGKNRDLKQQRAGQAAITYTPDFIGDG